MNSDDKSRLAEIQREVTRCVQRLASGCDKADDDHHDQKLAEFRAYVIGLRIGLTFMGMTEEAANEVIRKGGWDFKTNSYVVYRREPLAAWRRTS